MGVVEADDVLAAFAAFALNADQLFGFDVVAVLRGVGASVAGACDGSDDPRAVIYFIRASKQQTSALVGITLFALLAGSVLVGLSDAQDAPNTSLQAHR